MSPAPRKFHRVAAPWLLLPLVITLVTGVTYRLGRAWFGLSKEAGNAVMDIHAGEWLGKAVSPFYVLAIGVALLALLATGAALLIQSRAKKGARAWHRWLAFVLLLPLTASAVTGVACKLGEDWFHVSKDTRKLLLVIHEGAWLGPQLKPFYVLFIGLGLLVLALTGLRLVGWFARPRRAA